MAKLTELLYSKQTPIKCIKTATKSSNQIVAAGLPKSAARPAAAMNSSSKYSNIMVMMDELLIEHSTNALQSPSGVYCEVKRDGEVYRGLFDGRIILWESDVPPNPLNLMPIFLYSLKDNNPIILAQRSELENAFKECVSSYNDMGTVELGQASLLCDSFYYNCSYSNALSEYTAEPYGLSVETVQQGYSTGLFDFMPILEDVKDIPKLTGVNESERGKARRKKDSAKTVVNDFQECMDGKMLINYDWNEEQKLRIPAITTLADYVPEDTFYSILRKMNSRLNRVITRMDAGLGFREAIGNDYMNMLIVGKPGTGKTTMAYALGAATGMPTYTVAVSKHTEEDTFEGMNKVIDGKLQFVKTDFLDAYVNGGIIIIEEINLADPAVIMGAIGQAIEAPFVLKENGYNPVRRHPMCVIIGTMNIGTYGSRGVNQALSSRFKQSYVLDDPDKDTFIGILKKQGHKAVASKYVYTAYERINKYLKTPEVNREEICLNLSVRTCLGALENYADGDPMKLALKNSMVGKIYELDPELALDVEKNVISMLPDMK